MEKQIVFERYDATWANEIREEDCIIIDVLDKDEVERTTGFRMQADFYQELSIIENFWGEEGVREVVNNYISILIEDVYLYTELVFILNWKLWHHMEDNTQYVELYNALYRNAYIKGLMFYKGAEASYFVSTLD